MTSKLKHIATILLLARLIWSACAHSQSIDEPPRILQLTEIFQLPATAKGLNFTEQALAANGHIVRLTGYMVQQEQPTPGRFLLSPRPVMMNEDADGEADDLPAATAAVALAPAQQHWLVPHVHGLIEVTGQLQLGRIEASDHRVFWITLQLPESAIKGTP